MVSDQKEKKVFKIFCLACLVSFVLHAGVFFGVIYLSQTWGWIPVNSSFFEVSIISLMEKPFQDPSSKPSPQAEPAPVHVKKSQNPGVKKYARAQAKAHHGPDTKTSVPEPPHTSGSEVTLETNTAMDAGLSSPSGGESPASCSEITGSGGGNVSTFHESATIGNGSKLNYLNMVRHKIERHKKYPDAARQRNIEGQVTVEFEIGLDGTISEPLVAKSSGHPALDLAAVDAVKRASPFSSPPREYFTDTIYVNLPIRFELIR